MRKLFCSLILMAASATAMGNIAPAYVLDNTAVHELRAPDLKRDYQVFVSLPSSYKTSAKRYPVVFVTDANYAFPVGRALSARVGQNGSGIEEFILVGLSYAKGETAEYSRRRDYTPGQPADSNYKSDMPGRTPAFGEAEGYRRFIASEVFPLIDKTYRVDVSRKIFIGHSYGSLLGLHTLFTEPQMFSHYILGSPSLWYGKGRMFEREKSFAANHKDLKAKLFFVVGGLETKAAGRENDMVADLNQFADTLKSRRYPGLQMSTKVMEGEDHQTLAPILMTRGLKWALPPIH